MPQRRSPKTLRDVSHLFLSTGETQVRARPAGSAAVWLAVLARGENRAFLAAGLATAFAGHGARVTLVEIARGLPTVGYYFALDPAEYLAPILDRRTSLNGSWGDSIRFVSACDPELLPLVGPFAQGDGAPAVLVAAFEHEEDSIDHRFLDDLRRRLAPVGGKEPAKGGMPDCLVIASSDPQRGAAFADSVGSFVPVPVVIVAAPGSAAPVGGRASGETADGGLERLVIPPSLRAAWARRVPPTDPFFHGLASSALQMLSLERRRIARGMPRG